MLVGEQPGDQEDRAGEPFVGPAGELLAEALSAAGIDPEHSYVTNAVKHFRFEERGKRRLHRRPGVQHIDACRPWLAAELDVVAPQVVVCLGASAARSVLGRAVAVTKERGSVLREAGLRVLVTVHPSAVLRLRGRDGYQEAFDRLVHDLRLAASVLS
jgi:uracil-DNA glycosylase family protein